MRPSGNPFPNLAYHKLHQKVKEWNEVLHTLANKIEGEHKDTSIFVFPTWELFTDIIDNPVRYGFTYWDAEKPFGGEMWMDGLHPTSAVHKIIADHVVELLS